MGSLLANVVSAYRLGVIGILLMVLGYKASTGSPPPSDVEKSLPRKTHMPSPRHRRVLIVVPHPPGDILFRLSASIPGCINPPCGRWANGTSRFDNRGEAPRAPRRMLLTLVCVWSAAASQVSGTPFQTWLATLMPLFFNGLGDRAAFVADVLDQLARARSFWSNLPST